MSQANLLRLRELYPDVPPGEWASFFGWQWIGASQPDPENVSVRKQLLGEQAKREAGEETLPVIRKPTDPAFWYLSELIPTATDPQILPTASLAPDRTRKPGRVTIQFFDPTAYWRVELDRLLGYSTETDEPDIDRCVDQIAKCQPMPVIPGRAARSHSQSTLVVVDQNPSLTPLYGWQVQLLSLIRTLTGAQAMQRVGLHCPPFTSLQRKVLISESCKVERVVLLTTFDQRWCDRQSRSAWQKLIDQALEQGVDVTVLQPRLSGLDEQKVDWILASVIGLIYPNCDSLAALSRAFGGGLSEVMAVWNHPALTQQGNDFRIKSDYLRSFSAVYQRIPENKRARAAKIVAAHRALKPDCQIVMESLLAAALSREELPGQDWVNRLLQTIRATELTALKAYFNGLSIEYEQVREAFLDHGELSHFFELVDHAVFERDDSKTSLPDSYSLLGQSDGLKLVGNSHPQAVFTTSSAIMDGSGKELSLGDHPGLHTRQLMSQEHRFTLANLHRPAWAERIHRRTDGTLEAVHSEGARFKLLPASAVRRKSQWQLTAALWSWATDAGIDEHGLWATVSVDSVAYRLRWVPEGSFMMGSPETEAGRFNNEQLHQVTLSQGFWLGETTVTQKFWQAVVGQSPEPSHEDETLPVTNVTWDECQAFINNLKARHNSFPARLPSEAEWEYACRAGTETPYWWGEQMIADYANNGDGLKVETSYPANRYGLKSMHGNVREWCQDYYAEYPEGPVNDPMGPQRGQDRVLRGGSWILEPRSLRAAYRDLDGPGFRLRSYGFRLAGGSDPLAGSRRGATVAADRDEGTEEQRGGQGRPSTEQLEQSGS